jgi:hypothetical protein
MSGIGNLMPNLLSLTVANLLGTLSEWIYGGRCPNFLKGLVPVGFLRTAELPSTLPIWCLHPQRAGSL